MTDKKLIEEIGRIDMDYVLEAAPYERKNKISKRRGIIMKYATACVAVVIIIMGVGMFIHYQNDGYTPIHYAPVAKVCFDVNPGIEVEIDGNNIVVHVNAVNSDGENVIGGIDFTGKSIEEAALLLVESMLEKGYISKETNYLLLTIESERDMQELEDKLMAEISVSIKEVNGKVIVQRIEKTAEISEIAEMYGITVGKAKLIKGIAEKYTEMTLDELSKMTVTELSGFVYNKEEKTEFVYDYPYEIKAPEGCMEVTEAFDLVMKDLGYSPSEIKELRIDSVKIYGEDYEFRIYYGLWDYSGTVKYSVNGKTGAVEMLESTGGTTPYPGFVISHNDATRIAIDNVKDIFLSIEYLRTGGYGQHGTPHYIVEINGKSYDNEVIRYSVYIDAKTGEVLEVSKK